ncbi:preprotein translocase subunit SecG [Streptomyces sp. NBC_00378]|uniref:Protein-export membrane protein SecG n=1 Tax=Streptomyces sanglieri TaxID=193460 RepID=A0ABW2X6U1_9ACTN|nr:MULTISPECIES: preprotein translocase subunit SecG [unclassified Streptomyces]WSP54452.1 preprotein translocase subunit SecG [Streptomyces sp. NBC_01241]WSU24873.1 preprotein translocase subunit SecG [Streptomyces sp. NBC_01108]WTA35176.1 preprotein translocase subunit SecG [Streptomyces sp. NBC_00846]WTE33228.1 preprotein translocase subunit SecG [Streptomyces sp. NBC_01618]MCX4785985.1 preprotein translocase subunit SecG [Streptomyces sp. NBC_01221]
MILAFEIALIVFSLLLMLLVLMHKGKGGGLSDMFGGGMQSSVGGSSVAERNLDRITVFVGLAWFACIVVLGLLIKLDN